jgi:hypothetical protein
VAGVGQQRHRVRHDAVGCLNGDERHVQHGGDGERSPEGCAYIIMVMMMAMMVSVMMVMPVMRRHALC